MKILFLVACLVFLSACSTPVKEQIQESRSTTVKAYFYDVDRSPEKNRPLLYVNGEALGAFESYPFHSFELLSGINEVVIEKEGRKIPIQVDVDSSIDAMFRLEEGVVTWKTREATDYEEKERSTTKPYSRAGVDVPDELAVPAALLMIPYLIFRCLTGECPST